MKVAEQSLELTEQQVELSQKRYDLGAAKKTDLLKSKVARGTAKSALITQRALVFNAIAELRNSLGMIGDNNEVILVDENTTVVTSSMITDVSIAVDAVSTTATGRSLTEVIVMVTMAMSE